MPKVPFYISIAAFVASLLVGLLLWLFWEATGGSHDFALSSGSYGGGMVYVGLLWAWDRAYGSP
jgi:hypothetical protein